MWSIFSLTLILGGGFSNFFDRLQLDAVIDYLNFFNIFTFNLADAMIFVGVILFFIRLFFIKAPTPEQRDLNKSF